MYCAQFDHTKPDPKKVVGWYDTTMFNYPAMPPTADLLELTADQWAGRLTNPDAWAVSGGALIAYIAPVPPPTPSQQAAALLTGGLAVTSTSAPALNGTYAVDAAAQSHVQAEIISILVNGTFADGGTALAWPDTAGTVHTFPSVVEFKAFAMAVASFVAACAKVANGTSTTLPAATVEIA